MATANEELASAAVRHAIGLQRYTSGELRRMMALLNRVDADIAAIMQKYDPTDVAPRYAEQRLEKMLIAIRELNAEVYDAFVKALSGDMRDLAAYEAEFQAKLIDDAIPVDFDVVKPPPAQVRAAALSRPFQGRLLKEWGKDLEASAFAKVRDSIRIGFVEGETIDQLVRRIRGTRVNQFKDGILEINRRNAEALVRTAVSHTANSARQDVFEANSDIVKGIRWLSVLDGKTSAVCRSRDGTVYPIDKGPRPPAHWNCLPGDALVTSRSRVTGVSKRWFDGELVVVKTASGRELSCTPNHPVLTGAGWVAAGLLNVGGNVVCDGGREWEAIPNGDSQNMPASIHEVTEAFLASRGMFAVPVPTAAEDFHGDGMEGDVAIVWSDSLLRDADESAFGKPFGQLGFKLGGAAVSLPLKGFGGHSLLGGLLLAASHGLVGGLRKAAAFMRRGAGHARELLLASVAWFAPVRFQYAYNGRSDASERVRNASRSHAAVEQPQDFGDGNVIALGPILQRESGLRNHAGDNLVGDTVSVGNRGGRLARVVGGEDHLGVKSGLLSEDDNARSLEPGGDGRDADAELARQIAGGSAGPVFLDEIVHVETRVFAGHVFNLETELGAYSANGIVTHNCRSTTVPVLKTWREMGIDADEADAGTRAAMNGQVPASETYDSWLRKQPVEFQNEVLGATKARLFRAGLTMDRFVNRAGDELTLDELRRKEADIFKKAGV